MKVNADNIKMIFSSNEYPYLYVYKEDNSMYISTDKNKNAILILPNITSEKLGNKDFKEAYGLKYAYYAGAMASGISSVDMVIALGKAGFMGSYGTGGLSVKEVEEAIESIKKALPNGPYLINVISNIANSSNEMKMAKMLIKKNITAIEASAYIQPSQALIYYRLNGTHKNKNGNIEATHKIIAKVSREEVGARFFSPADSKIVNELMLQGLITREEAECAPFIPLASDVTVEGDSGGHTDNRPLISIFPAFVSLRNSIQNDLKIHTRIGAGGGIATGKSALAAFAMGADYVVTGSINQSCVEAGTSEYVREILAKAKMYDTVMCPSADMFEMGGRVQVIKTGTMFPQKAQKLYNYYKKYQAFEAIPEKDRVFIEKQILKDKFYNVWENTREYFWEKDPKILERAELIPKIKMALVFRWYLGNASHWAINDVKERRMDMQIWCGQSMGAFNLWVKGTELENPEKRNVVSVAKKIMESAAFEQNIQFIKLYNVFNI